MSQKIQELADETGKEISSSVIWEIFEENFLKPKNNFSYQSHTSSTKDDVNKLEVKMIMNAKEINVSGTGNGPIDSFVNGLSKELDINIKIADYHQSAISSGSDAQAAAYIELEKDGQTKWGVGINPNTTRASFEAIIVGLSKIL
jgi:2-isopropylmalate synthase